jgi:hypothetical protein
MEKSYSLMDISLLTGKSKNLIYRRLTEKNSRYKVRFARKEGATWIFDKAQVDKAIGLGESIIVSSTSMKAIDDTQALTYFSKESRSCGRGS